MFFGLKLISYSKSSHLEKEPVVGMEEKKEPMMLHAPRAIISWLASRGFPPARRQDVNLPSICFDLQNALAIATDSRMAMMGMMMKALPRLLAMSPKEMSSTGNVWFATLCLGIEKGGKPGCGIPPFMSPVRVNVQLSLGKKSFSGTFFSTNQIGNFFPPVVFTDGDVRGDALGNDGHGDDHKSIPMDCQELERIAIEHSLIE